MVFILNIQVILASLLFSLAFQDLVQLYFLLLFGAVEQPCHPGLNRELEGTLRDLFRRWLGAGKVEPVPDIIGIFCTLHDHTRIHPPSTPPASPSNPASKSHLSNYSMAAPTNSRSPSPLPPTSSDPSPSNSGNSSSKAGKRTNPLIDLIESEKEYVDLLAGVIRVRVIFVKRDSTLYGHYFNSSTFQISESGISMVAFKLSPTRAGFHVQRN
jgi:hypothetical protein